MAPTLLVTKAEGFFTAATFDFRRQLTAEVIASDFLDRYIENCRLEAPMLAFLAKAVGAAW